MRDFELTFGCDGASAAAPIANANTAFILRHSFSSMRQLDDAKPGSY